MVALSEQQVRLLCEIVSRVDGRPEAFYRRSGTRGRVLGYLLSEGYLERVCKEQDGATLCRLKGTEKGRQWFVEHHQQTRGAMK